MKTIINAGVRRGSIRRMRRTLVDVFALLKNVTKKDYHYTLCIFCPTKELKPEVKKEIERIAGKSDDVSPIFTSTKDAEKWLTSQT